MNTKRKWTYSNIAVRPSTKRKYAAAHRATKIPFADLADKAIDALMEKGAVSLVERKPDLVTA